MKLVILMAGSGIRLGLNKTKAMIEFGGKTLAEYTISIFKDCGIKDVILVIGFGDEEVQDKFGHFFNGVNIAYVYNSIYQTTGTTHSLRLAKDWMKNEEIVFAEGDILMHPTLVRKLIYNNFSNCMLVDECWKQPYSDEILLIGSDSKINKLFWDRNSKEIPENVVGSAIGVVKLSKKAVNDFINVLDFSEDFEYVAPLNQTINQNEFHYLFTEGKSWIEIDTKEDLEKANKVWEEINA